MTNSSPSAPISPQFAVVTDGGIDAFPDLDNKVPVAPFAVNFGPESFKTFELTQAELYQRLRGGGPHPTSSQPSPQDWLSAIGEAQGTSGLNEVLAITISSGLSGSRNAAEQARSLSPAQIVIHDSGTLTGAQAFQVHAAVQSARRGESVQEALGWLHRVHEQTEMFFTLETLEYLQRGGRIGRVQAALGGLLDLKPIVTVDKASGAYTNAARARSYGKALGALADQITRRYGEGTPLRVGFMSGSHPEDAETVRQHLAARHTLLWTNTVPVNVVLNIHTGPRCLGVVAAPGPWPWEAVGGA